MTDDRIREIIKSLAELVKEGLADTTNRDSVREAYTLMECCNEISSMLYYRTEYWKVKDSPRKRREE